MVTDVESLSWSSYDEEVPSSTDLEKSAASEIDGTIIVSHAGQSDICPTFGDISICNGSDIHFGNKTFYHGPVTIKQFVVADEDQLKKIRESDVAPSVVEKSFLEHLEGVDNPGFKEDGTKENEVGNSDTTLESVGNSDVRFKYFKDLDLKKILQQHKIIVVLFCFFLVILLISGIFLIQLSKSPESVPVKHSRDIIKFVDEENSHNTPIEGPIDPTKIKPLVLKLVSRLEWLAQPPSSPSDPLETPVPYVIISHTATETCKSQAQCVFQVRTIQTFHMESKGWWDIAYNFLVGGDGEVYVGRGWDKEGSHTLGYNKYSIGISFIGTFMNILPTDNQLLACKRLIERGVQLGYVRKDYKLVGARQLQTTQSPGTKLFEELKKWPHWSETP